MSYVGRLAPSPTGAQHLGNARTFLVAWLHCRLNQGRLLLRIEDLDTPRTKKGADKQAVEDLLWLGIDWDEVEDGKHGCDPLDSQWPLQSLRQPRFDFVLQKLKELDLVYPCSCSRSDVEQASSAPHESMLDGIVYPGTCATKNERDVVSIGSKSSIAWRFRFPDGEMNFHDELYGNQRLNAKHELGDFVVARSYGGSAYQLAVVVDDHDFGVNWVVRGADLIYSTYRQIALYRALGWESPRWLHVPLVVGADGRRLAKRHGDTRLSSYRERDVDPAEIVSFLAKSLQMDVPDRITPSQLLQLLREKPNWLHSITKAPFVIS